MVDLPIYMYHKFKPNVGKYIIHGSCGYEFSSFCFTSLHLPSHHLAIYIRNHPCVRCCSFL